MKKMKGGKYHYLLTPYLVKIYLLIFIIIILYATYYRSLLSNDKKRKNKITTSENSKGNKNIKEGFKDNKEKDKSDNKDKSDSKDKSDNKDKSDSNNKPKRKTKDWQEAFLLQKNNTLASKSKEKLLKQELKSKEKQIKSIEDKYKSQLKVIEKVITSQDGNVSSFEAIKKLVDENQKNKSQLKLLKSINKTIISSKELESDLSKLSSDNEEARLESVRKLEIVEDDYNNLIKSSQEALLKKENEKLSKYNKNLNDHLEKERKNKTSIDLLKVGGDIESGLIGAAKYLGKIFNDDKSNNSNNSNSGAGHSKKREGFANYTASNSYKDSFKDSYETVCDSNSSIQSRYFGKPVSDDLITVEPFISEGWQESESSSKEESNSKLKALSNKFKKTSDKTDKNNKDGDIEGMMGYILSLVEYATGTNLKSVTGGFKDLTGILIKENNIISTGFLFVFLAFILFFINITM
jgi:hypothetical protein